MLSWFQDHKSTADRQYSASGWQLPCRREPPPIVERRFSKMTVHTSLANDDAGPHEACKAIATGGPSCIEGDDALAKLSTDKQPETIRVVVGNSAMAVQDSSLPDAISRVTMKAGGKRFSVSEAKRRLSMGDGEPNAGRVLHVAFIGEQVVGCCSSTVGWSGSSGGHWGALSVDPSVQGLGVASALVDAAETRLLERGCTRVQIEYHYSPGDPESERLRSWYEGRLGFSGSGCGFRFCHKRLSAADILERKQRRASRSQEPLITNGMNRSSTQSNTSIDGLTEKQGNDAEHVYKDILGKKALCRCTMM